MPEGTATQQQQDAAAQNKGALDLATVKTLIADAVTAAVKPLADAQKVIADTMIADAKEKADAKTKADAAAASAATKGDPNAAAKPLTAEDIAKITNDAIANALKTRDTEAQSTAARNAFIKEKLTGLPDVYQEKLGNDPAKWAAEEQTLRTKFQDALKASGAVVKDVGGGNAGGGSAVNGAAKPLNPNLTPGQAAFANSIRLPGRA